MAGPSSRRPGLAPRLEPVRDVPALRLAGAESDDDPIVVVADLHLGLGALPDRPGGPPEGSADRLAERALDALDRARARHLVIAGDIKHPILGTPPGLRPLLFDFFGRILEAGHRVEVVLGNHDVGLTRWLPSEVTVHPPVGIVRHGTGIFHGHRWPSNPVLRAPAIVAGHLHPGFRLAPTADDPSGKRPCWVRVRREPSPSPTRRKRRHAPLAAREIVVMPPFNPLAGIEALNRERPARGRSFLFGRFLSAGEARAYLLDGTDLGRISTPVGRDRTARRET